MKHTEQYAHDWLKKTVSASLTGKGARRLTDVNVEQLISYIADKPYIIGRIEAKRIESDFDRDMAEYSIYGIGVPAKDEQHALKEKVISMFRQFNREAQNTEKYAVHYDVWLSEME